MTTTQPDLAQIRPSSMLGKVSSTSLGMRLLMATPDESEVSQLQNLQNLQNLARTKKRPHLDESWLSTNLNAFIKHNKTSARSDRSDRSDRSARATLTEKELPTLEEILPKLLEVLTGPLLEKMDDICQLSRQLDTGLASPTPGARATGSSKLFYNKKSGQVERRHYVEYSSVIFLEENGIDLAQRLIDEDGNERTIREVLFSEDFEELLIAKFGVNYHERRQERGGVDECGWIGYFIRRSPMDITVVLDYR